MAKVKIVTDSTADLPADIVQRYGITVVPLKVFMGQETFLDGVDINPEQFFKRQVQNKELSTTSQPTPNEFIDFYEPMVDEGHAIISIHISSLMSGTVQSALLAKQMLAYSDLEVVDTGLTSVALGMVVLVAARAAEQGRGKNDILQLVHRAIEELQVYFAVDTLEYLQRGGRIGKAAAFLGTLLNVKPILSMKEGLVHPSEKVRGNKYKSIDRLIKIMQEKFGGQQLICFLVHGQDLEGLSVLREKVALSLKCVEILEGQLGPVVGTHVGPSVLGVVCLPARD